MNLTEYNNKLKSSKIAILGLGVSNIPLLEYLHNLGCDVVVFNTKPLDKNLIDKLNIYKIKYYNEENAFDYLHGFDIIFRSPSILPTRKELVIAKEEGAVITSEIRELLHLAPCKVIGVTGSDGKTTTTTLINEILKANSYHTFLGGNIGTPLFTKLPEMKKEDIIVLELSSFQLMDMDISPDISIITNIAENHLDIHSSFEEYIDAKKNIFKYQDNKGILVTNADNEITNKFKGNGETRYFSRSKQTNYFYTDGTYIYYNGKKILNKNDKTVKLNNFIVNVYDENKNIIGTFNPYVGGEIESNKSNNISFSIKEDYSKANSIEIELPELEFIER